MKVFISWSGSTSGAIAEQLHTWLPTVIQAVTPYYSPEDISKGTRWSDEIARELEEAHIGIICLTRDNLSRPWLLFEAGALSKNIAKSRVIPLLFGITSTDVGFPLATFQSAPFNQVEMRRVLNTINAALGGRALNDDVLTRSFDKFWPDLETKVQSLLEASQKTSQDDVRSDRSMLEELLTITRDFAQVNTRAPTPAAIRLLVTSVIELGNHLIDNEVIRISTARYLYEVTRAIDRILFEVDPLPVSIEELDALLRVSATLEETLKQAISPTARMVRRPTRSKPAEPPAADEDDVPF